MANPRKFSEKIALHNQKQAEETAAFEKIMREVSDATNKVNSGTRRTPTRRPVETPSTDDSLKPCQPSLGTFRSGSLPNVAAPLIQKLEQDDEKPEETTLASQYGIGQHVGATSPSRSPGQRGRTPSSVGPMRSRPAERKHDTSPYGSTVYLSPPPDSSWRRTNSDSALHQSCGGAGGNVGDQQQMAPSMSPHHMLHNSHGHPHQNHRRAADVHLDALSNMGVNINRPRSSCEMPRIPNNNPYDSGGGGGVPGGGGLMCGELQVPGGSLPDLTSVHFPPPHTYPVHPHRTSPDYHHHSPTSPGAVSPGAGAISPATGGLSPASGSPVGATVPLAGSLDHALHVALRSDNTLYDTQNHLSVPNTNNYLHHNKNMSPLDHSWITSSYQSHCSPPSQYSSTSNINLSSPSMVHSPGSPIDSPQSDYLHHALLQPFEQITMLDAPTTIYNTSYMNHNSPISPQSTMSPLSTNSPHSYPQSPHRSPASGACGIGCGTSMSHECRMSPRTDRDPVPGGNGHVFSTLTSPSTPATPSIPDIILTDYSGDLESGIFGGEEAQLRAGLDLDDLTLLEEPNSLLPDSSVEHEFRLDRL